MSDKLNDELLKLISDVLSVDETDVAVSSSEIESQRAQTVLARVMTSVQSGERQQQHVKRSQRLTARSFRWRVVTTFSIAFALILLTGVVVSIAGGNGRLRSPITTAWQPGTSLTTSQVSGASVSRHGAWMLADGSLSGTWQQTAVGPPGDGVTCPTASACFEMDEVTAAPVENSPLLSVAFYASTDVGVTWTKYSMPSGFSPTTFLSCGSDSDCDAGGTYNGQSVLVSTTNAGHSFIVAPLPSAAGTLLSLSCSSGQFCGGLTSEEAPYSAFYHPGALGNGQPTNATFLSTSDGSTFTSGAIATGNSLWTLECTSSLDCITVGDRGSLSDGTNNWAEGVTETTSDGGSTWTSGILPSGFAISSDSVLSCADATHCSVLGRINVPIENPPACSAKKPYSKSPPPLRETAGVPNAVVETIVQFESSLITSANLQATPNTEGFSCLWPPQTPISDVLSTADGGSTWTPDQLPAGVPGPSLVGLSCPTDNECWASGSDENAQLVPGGADPGESILLGTIDGGATWSTVTFNVPPGTPSFQSSFGDGIGRISCPTANVCTATGIGMADSASLPFYSLAIPSVTT